MINLILHNLFSFVFIISLIVFVHEFGHFWVARLCGVKVDEFAIGFGRQLFGFKDKKGTCWKLCLWPFGGYVRMHGDRNAASMPDEEAIKSMSEAEKKKSFITKNVYQRMAIVTAGPIANFIFTIFIFTILFKISGLNTILPIVDEVLPNSAAYEANLKKGDEIVAIDGKEIKDFDAMRQIVMAAADKELLFKIKREEKIITVKITPKIQSRKDMFDDDVKVATLGVSAASISHQDLNLWQSFVHSGSETFNISGAILKTLGELIIGKRSVKELGGPVRIAEYSGKTVSMGITAVLWFMAMISLNLGVMNLLPVPVLDGGHLFYYIIEALRGKPLSQQAQQYGFQVGLALVLSLMIFTTVNDVLRLLN